MLFAEIISRCNGFVNPFTNKKSAIVDCAQNFYITKHLMFTG